jgi:tRNA U34 5-methylaminomethyl-2-thiouridine-forming methyltransferase MnmC
MLTDDGSRTLFDRRLDESFHSGCGALSECQVVYLRNSGLENLFGQAAQTRRTHGDPVRVLEFGFGTGMAALLTLAAAHIHDCPLEFVSLERELLPTDVLRRLEIGRAVDVSIRAGRLANEFAVTAQLEQAWLAFREQLPDQPPAGHYHWPAAAGLNLHLILGQAQDWLGERIGECADQFDAIYFDAFSPASNPDLWAGEVFAKLKNALKQTGLLVSYCVNGQVRRALEQAGFKVMRLPGPPGGKREVLAAGRA